MRKTAASMLVIAGCLAGWAPAAHACRNVNGAPSQITEAQAEASTICLVNKRRSHRHLHPLRAEMRLWTAARGHSQAMGSLNYFSHYGDGTPESRAAATGYMSSAGSWGIGETLGWGAGGAGTPRFIVAEWMASPEHRAVILTKGFRQIGVGVTDASPTGPDDGGTMIYTADFGYRHMR
jgi:uncharacterized protein YkwD